MRRDLQAFAEATACRCNIAMISLPRERMDQLVKRFDMLRRRWRQAAPKLCDSPRNIRVADMAARFATAGRRELPTEAMLADRATD